MQKKVYTLLIVDDDKDTCRIMSRIFREKGYLVNIAYNGRTALQRVSQQPYDLMILDYHLLKEDGLAIFEKTSRIRPFLRTIMISASANEAVKEKAQSLGAYEFFHKPFDVEHLLSVVKTALTNQKSRSFKYGMLKDTGENIGVMVSKKKGG